MKQSILRCGITLAGSISILVLMAVLCVSFLGPSMKSKPSYYDAKAVLFLCDLFQIDKNDSFCASPSVQGQYTFEAALNRKFPINEAHYNDIVPYIGKLHTTVVSCTGPQNDDSFKFCPLPNECGLTPSNTYDCQYFFSDTQVGFVVTFANSSGVIVDYLGSQDGNGS